MNGRQWLTGMGLTLSIIVLVVLGWEALMGYGEHAHWMAGVSPRGMFLTILIGNLINIAIQFFNLRRAWRKRRA